MSALMIVSLTSQSLFAQTKLGYINSQKILASYKEAQDVQTQLDARNQEWQKELQDLLALGREKQDQLEKQALMLSSSKKTELQQEIGRLSGQVQQFQTAKWGQEGEAFKLQDTLLRPILDKINNVIQDIGKRENFDFIFDSVAGNIIFASDSQPDLTEKVLEELNKGISQ